MKWVLAQPENHLSVLDAFVEMDQVRWALDHECVVADPWQGNLVRTDLNRMLESTSADMKEDLYISFDEQFGMDTENWKEIEVLPTINRIIAQGSFQIYRRPGFMSDILLLSHAVLH